MELTCNFRSSQLLVDWVNQHFKFIFPQVDDVESGAISFHSSVSIKPTEEQHTVQAFQYKDRIQEAQGLVERVKLELATYPNEDIAILVRSRNQLSAIVQCLKEHHIPFQGVDIDLLAQLPHLRDVWSLTQALLMPADRLAWLSFLRSPWCGLSLNDLLVIARYSKQDSIYFALSELDNITELSDEGRLRAQFIYTVLNDALTSRYQQSLTKWLIDILQKLHMDSILEPYQKEDLEQFWQLLDRHEKNGLIEDFSQFNEEFNKLYSQQVMPARVKIMTIHKSKGLEFDCVMLPGLGIKASQLNTPLLRWLKLPSQDKGELILLSPIKASYHETCLLYNYLGQLDAQKNSYELQRLLYVAVTRAKKRLYLSDSSEKVAQGTFRALLQSQPFTSFEQDITESLPISVHPSLYKLPLFFYQSNRYIKESSITNELSDSSIILDSKPRLMGVVIHELLQWICDHHPSTLAEIPWELAYHRLSELGLTGLDLQQAKQQLQQQLTFFFNDPIGSWLIQPRENECNEYEILVDEQTLKTKIIDRTFCENGIRWIIDFKSGADDETSETHHRQQVNDYARLLINVEQQPIYCGLYYLASNRWLTWEYINT